MSYVLSQVDIPGLITAKLLKVSMKHIEIITKARQKGNHLNFYISFTARVLSKEWNFDQRTLDLFLPPSEER